MLVMFINLMLCHHERTVFFVNWLALGCLDRLVSLMSGLQFGIHTTHANGPLNTLVTTCKHTTNYALEMDFFGFD